MKTLSEVIMCLEGCGHIDCDDCPYHYEDEKIEIDDCGQVYKDALHYLKAYKDDRNDLTALRAYWAEQQENNPLTMEYFSKLIDTEPIWCEELGEWYLFLAYDDGENEIQLMSDKGDIETFDEEDLEKYPLYRRKNESTDSN